MKFMQPTHIGKIQSRYKRFFADVALEDQIVTAHVPNTGSMKTCWAPGWKVLVTQNDDPKRKLRYTLEMTHNKNSWIGINTSRPNKMATEAIKNGVIKEFRGAENIRPEVKVGNSRIDLLVDGCYVEVKNVTLSEGRKALFPDAVTTRGQKHLKELIDIKNDGKKAAILFVVQREDIECFDSADSIDPEYGRLLRRAQKEGVEILVYGCRLSPKETSIKAPLPCVLQG